MLKDLFSIESEKAVLCCIMKYKSNLKAAINTIEEGDFNCKKNLIVFLALRNLIAKGIKIDLPMVTEELGNYSKYEVIDFAYISDIYNCNCLESNFKDYIRIIKRYRYLRLMSKTLKEINSSIKLGRVNYEQIHNKLLKCIFYMKNVNREENISIREQVRSIYNYLINKDRPILYKTGFNKLDNIISGILPGELVIVAGRPATGKTSFCINILKYNSIVKNNTVFFFSLEMSASQVIIKLVSLMASIDSRLINSKNLNIKETNEIIRALKVVMKSNIYLYDDTFTSTIDIYNYVIKRKSQSERNIIIIDYVQLIKITSISGNRSVDISEISSYLKNISKELNTPIILISQLNRQIEQRLNKTPILSDLRESGSLEQDADKVIFLSRDYFSSNRNEDISVVIGKNRNGPTGTIKLKFIKKYNIFVDA
ncbi:hypothetical protein JSR06_00495 [Candidatus Vidania fulgoroideae]|uniref:DNA 5'-3' helicase n=1 Tax=Candidatus Vidania fulgoroideorum TaxID=881286 RepID=A0A975AEH3_9PROT|nr:hypothetical protein JSR06_00495 [Candidatus Vidania fulgoroideae]